MTKKKIIKKKKGSKSLRTPLEMGLKFLNVRELKEAVPHRKKRRPAYGGNRQGVKIKDKRAMIRKEEKITDVLVGLKSGLSVNKAMMFAGLNNNTFYEWRKVAKKVTSRENKDYDRSHPLYDFERRVAEAKSYLEKTVKTTIHNVVVREGMKVKSGSTDMPNTKWYAERKLSEEFGKSLSLTGAGGKDLVPEEKKKAIKTRLKELLK